MNAKKFEDYEKCLLDYNVERNRIYIAVAQTARSALNIEKKLYNDTTNACNGDHSKKTELSLSKAKGAKSSSKMLQSEIL
jgi:hypothetical protein